MTAVPAGWGTRPLIGTSWKMNLTRPQARDWARAVRARVGDRTSCVVFVLPPFVAIDAVREELRGSDIRYGAQNCHHEDFGPHTGEVSPPMLADLGCALVEVGHSERRRYQCETDAIIAAKVRAILRAGMSPLICIGGPEREVSKAHAIVMEQLETILGGVGDEDLSPVLLAYEPWWAIGEGAEAASVDHVAVLHKTIHAWMAARGQAGARVPVLYGGSVDLDTAPQLLATPGVDGLFVGRAALDPERFARIVAATAGQSGAPSTREAAV